MAGLCVTPALMCSPFGPRTRHFQRHFAVNRREIARQTVLVVDAPVCIQIAENGAGVLGGRSPQIDDRLEQRVRDRTRS